MVPVVLARIQFEELTCRTCACVSDWTDSCNSRQVDISVRFLGRNGMRWTSDNPAGTTVDTSQFFPITLGSFLPYTTIILVGVGNDHNKDLHSAKHSL